MRSHLAVASAGTGAAEKQISKEWLEAKGAVVFVTVDDVQNTFARDDCRTGEAEIQRGVAAIGAFKDGGDLSFVRCAATFTERRVDESDFRSATRADEAFGGGCSGIPAKLANLRITERQGGIDPLFEGLH